MPIIALFIVCLISACFGAAALVASLTFGRGKHESGWLHLLRACGAAAGCFAGLFLAVLGSVLATALAPAPGQNATIAISAALIASPILCAVCGYLFARPALRLAYLFTHWLAREVGVADA